MNSKLRLNTRNIVVAVSCVLVTGLSLTLSSCGDSKSSPGIAGGAPVTPASPAPSGAPGQVAEVTISIAAGSVSLGDQAYGENPRRIPRGTTVTWINDDSLPHTVTSEETGVFDSGTIPPGGRFSHTFAEAGTYPYFCAIHPSMTGTIEVEDSTSPGTTPSPEPSPVPSEDPSVVPSPTPEGEAGDQPV